MLKLSRREEGIGNDELFSFHSCLLDFIIGYNYYPSMSHQDGGGVPPASKRSWQDDLANYGTWYNYAT